MNKNRSDIEKKDKWSIEKIFSSEKDWHLAYAEIKPKDAFLKFKEILCYKDKLNESEKIFSSCLEKYFNTARKLEKLFTYAHLYLDEDLSNDKAKNIFGLISNLLVDFETNTAWIEPEILQIEEKKLRKYLLNPSLKDFRFYIEKLLKLKQHTLSKEQEEILARSSQSLEVCDLVFSSLNNADIKFNNILDKNNKTYPLSHATYFNHLQSEDRVLRKNAFENYHQKYLDLQNSLTELLYGNIKNTNFVSNARKYKSSLEFKLFPNNIDAQVYFNLIKTVKENISSLHKYVTLKKEKLQVDKVHIYDLYTSIVKKIELKKSYEEAKKIVLDSVSILGEDYKNMLKKGLNEDRWIDVYETKNKKSGAYSSGCYDSLPYILLNFEGSLNDIFTLAHESGHSMHTLLANKNQSYIYSHYPIFLAEIASIFNEHILFDLLIKTLKKEEEKKYIINFMLDNINRILFRQTLFAEFELEIHNMQNKNIPLTTSLLKKIYKELYQFYYGKDFEVDDLLQVEWARVPHFYSPFYVYQYAIGFSIALFASKKIKKDPSYKEKYLSILKKGDSDYPLNILKDADIDILKPVFITEAIQYFNDLLENFKN